MYDFLSNHKIDVQDSNALFGSLLSIYAAFAWLKCKEDIDLEKFIRGCIKMQGRTGRKFGTDQNYLRISMLSKDDVFDHFLERLSTIKAISNGY